MSFSSIILAGGKSKRMGTNKSTLKINGTPLIIHIMNSLKKAGCSNFIIQIKSEKDKEILQPLISNFNIYWSLDGFENSDLIRAIYSGLILAKKRGWDVVQLVPIDTPYVSANLFQVLVRELKHHLDIIIPKSDHSDFGLEPLLSHLRVGPLIKKIKAEGNKKNKSLGGIFCEMKHEIISLNKFNKYGISKKEFKNLNSPEDLES